MLISEATEFGFATADEAASVDVRVTLPGRAAHVLPVFTGRSLREAVAELSFSQLQACLKSRLLPLPGGEGYAICGERGRFSAERAAVQVAARISPREFLQVVRSSWGEALRQEATSRLEEASPHLSARQRFSRAQIAALLALCVAATTAAWFVPLPVMAKAAALLLSLLFFAVVAMRVLVLLPHFSPQQRSQPRRDDDLPLYSVLVPLFRETAVLDQLLAALGNLDYPHARLDIKIIVEAGDEPMRRALAEFRLPAHFEVIVVPAGTPQTKPRALNYALQFAYGELVTIYDAEDLPSPTQLRRCVEAFAAAPPGLACLQARLTIYNSNENWLTRQFALEYAALFGEVLPGLANLGLPLPLGGTSNHFRTRLLRRVGGWDPFNVTEDADLGLRLARLGYATATVASDTFEEACVTYRSWHRQRARWLKGFLQTWLVHMRAPLQCWRQLGPAGFCILQTMTIGVFVSALLHPLLLGLALWTAWTAGSAPQSFLDPSTWLDGFSLMIFATGYGASIWIAARTVRRNAMIGWWPTLATLPLYWLLLTPAAWLALRQFITDLHGWNKTPHGQSRLRA